MSASAKDDYNSPSRAVAALVRLVAIAQLGLWIWIIAVPIGRRITLLSTARLTVDSASEIARELLVNFLETGLLTVSLMMAFIAMRRPTAGLARMVLLLGLLAVCGRMISIPTSFFRAADEQAHHAGLIKADNAREEAFIQTPNPADSSAQPEALVKPVASHVEQPVAVSEAGSHTWLMNIFGGLCIAAAFALADLLVYTLQRWTAFGEGSRWSAEAGAMAWLLRLLLVATTLSTWSLIIFWDQRPAIFRGHEVVLLPVLGASVLINFLATYIVIRNNGWLPKREYPILPNSSGGDRWEHCIRLRKALDYKSRLQRCAGYLFILFVTVTMVAVPLLQRLTQPPMNTLPESAITFINANSIAATAFAIGVPLAVGFFWAWRIWRGGVIAATLLLGIAGLVMVGTIGLAVYVLWTSWRFSDAVVGQEIAAGYGIVALIAYGFFFRGALAVFLLRRIAQDRALDGRAMLWRVRGKKRPWIFASGRYLAVGALVLCSLIARMIGFVFAFSLELFTVALGAESNPAYWPAITLWRRARAAGAASANETRRRDSRRPILLLRSFKDDGMPMQAGWLFGDAFQAAWMTFEEVVTDRLWRRGPVVAIGQPGEPLPRLGAAREYVAHDAWQARVMDMANDAGLIVLVVGRTPGVAWEFARLTAAGMLGRLALMLPPSDPMETQIRWDAFLDGLPEGDVFASLRRIDPRSALMITFPSHWTEPFYFVHHTRTRIAYEAAIDLAGYQLQGRATSPRPPGKALQAQVADLMAIS